jgi:hypothetical protein
MVTHEMQKKNKQVQTSQTIIALQCVLVLLMEIDVVVVPLGLVLTSSCPFGVPLPLLLYPRRQSYKEGNRVGYNMITMMTLFLLVYFTYIFYRYNYLYLGEYTMIL